MGLNGSALRYVEPFDSGDTFHLPPPTAKLPARVNPDTLLVEHLSAQWARRYLRSAFHTDEELDGYIRQQSGLWGCYVAPGVRADILLLIVEWTSALFLLDDALIGSAAAKVFARQTLSGSGRPGVSADTELGFEAAIDDLWIRTRAALSAPLYERLVRNLNRYLDGALAETSYHTSDQIPDPESLLEQRRETVAIRFFLVLVEAGIGIELSDAALAEMEPATLRALEHISFVNDLFSFRREHYEGDHINLITALRTHENLTLQDAVDRIYVLLSEAEDALLRSCRQLLCHDRDPAVDAYLDALCHFAGGNQHWSYIAARYHGDEFRWNGVRTGTVTLLPDRTVFTAGAQPSNASRDDLPPRHAAPWSTPFLSAQQEIEDAGNRTGQVIE
jgi:terpene synthase-like protein